MIQTNINGKLEVNNIGQLYDYTTITPPSDLIAKILIVGGGGGGGSTVLKVVQELLL